MLFGSAVSSSCTSSCTYSFGTVLLAGQLGWRGYLYQNWNRFFDASIVKRTTVHEKINVEFRATALNVFNLTNFGTGASGTNYNNIGSASDRSAAPTAISRARSNPVDAFWSSCSESIFRPPPVGGNPSAGLF